MLTIITNLEKLKMHIVPKRVINQIKLDEGFRAKAYTCSAGKLTIGYGRNIEDNGVTEEEAERMLLSDVNASYNELRRHFKWFPVLAARRQGVLINMCFNMGMPTLLKFEKMFTAIREGDYNEAAAQMLDSKWAKQVGERAERLAEEMRLG